MSNANTITLTIDDKSINVIAGTTVLAAARLAEIYIPTLCSHPDLSPVTFEIPRERVFQGEVVLNNIKPSKTATNCGMCIVEMHKNKVKTLVNSCVVEVQEGMSIVTNSEAIRNERRKNLIPILRRHRHSCLVCAQQEGCSQTQCSSNVPENERCCSQFNNCELRNIINYVGIPDDRPKWNPNKCSVIETDPLLKTDYNLCIGCLRCVRVCNNVRGVGAIGFVWDIDDVIQVGTIFNTLSESGCRFCTACVEVCPTGALQDKIFKSGKKDEYLVPCKNTCPANVDIPEYLRMISQGEFDLANAIIREKVPLPATLGRICMHPCEDVCRRKEINGAVAICALKRFVSHKDFNGYYKKKSSIKIHSNTGKRIAIIGAGPAGLTSSFYLRKKGHNVTLFDRNDKAGGMLRYGIPNYRLPNHILDQEINDIISMGIEFIPKTKIGLDFDLNHLINEGYDAILMAIGMQNDREISVEGSSLKGVFGSLYFLNLVAKNRKAKVGKNVVIIGGGNVAIDVAMTAKRCGAETVSMVCLESIHEMPASSWEIETAKSEGIQIISSWSPMKISGKNGCVSKLEMTKCVSVFDGNGVFNPQCDYNVKKSIIADQIIMAIGQEINISGFKKANFLNKKGAIVINEKTMETTIPNVYSAGDMVSYGSRSVILAIASGRKAAESIDLGLGGTGIIDEVFVNRKLHNGFIGVSDKFVSLVREKEFEINHEKGCNNFKEIKLGFTDEAQAMREAKRCLQCDLRLALNSNPLPSFKKLFALTEKEIDVILPKELEGVYRLFDENKTVISIIGTPNLRSDLKDAALKNKNALFFEFEENKMYSKRESELIQEHLQEHGEMPNEDDDMDDLF